MTEAGASSRTTRYPTVTPATTATDQDQRHRHAATAAAAASSRRRGLRERRARRARRIELGVLLEDRPLQPLQLRSRLEPEVVREPAPSVAVDLERLGLAPAAVEREHQLATEPLAERVLVDARLELGHDRAVPAEPEQRLDPSLDRLEAKLVEAMDLALGELGERELAERRAAPEGERLLERRDGARPDRRRVCRHPCGREHLEPRRRRRRRRRGEGRTRVTGSRARRSRPARLEDSPQM